MPNSDEGAGQANYPKFEIGLGELVTKLEFNPMEVIKEQYAIVYDWERAIKSQNVE
ncbi:hypothetical protein [Mucilaginibacter sp.]|jgi:hypothetical protein|uniref:hypothetical protein n=1 Tax=Mucilaginibacter sp. TaxID=1882438 RepID=UPI0035643D7D